jgi:hypothetical protein
MKQQSDNILGAPAEGFGQNITFAFRPDDRNMPTLDAAHEARGASGVQGSPTNPGVPHLQPVGLVQHDPTMDLLSKVADAVIGPRIKQARAEAFVSGMQRAANGEAVKDIAEGQPWYTTIFGDGDVVEGARQYTAQAKAAEAAGAVEDSMGEVRKLAPDAAHGYYTDLIAKHLTGDAVTDAAVMRSFAGTLPATMRRQAKEHYAWRQEEASDAESRAFMANASLLQKRAGAATQTDDEYATNAVQFFSGMRPAAGRDLESWTKARTKDLLGLAQAGQFHAIGVIRNTGLLDQLHPDQRTKIESAIDTAENRTIANKSMEYAPELGRIMGEAEVYHDDLSAKNTYQQLSLLNEKFRKETGIDRDLISLDKGAGIVKDATRTILREGERRVHEADAQAKVLAAKGDKALAEQKTRDGALAAITVGGAAAAARVLPDAVVHEQFYKAFTALGQQGPDAQAALLFSNYAQGGYVHPDVKKMYETRGAVAIGAAMPDDFLSLHGSVRRAEGAEPGPGRRVLREDGRPHGAVRRVPDPGQPGQSRRGRSLRGRVRHAGAPASDPAGQAHAAASPRGHDDAAQRRVVEPDGPAPHRAAGGSGRSGDVLVRARDREVPAPAGAEHGRRGAALRRTQRARERHRVPRRLLHARQPGAGPAVRDPEGVPARRCRGRHRQRRAGLLGQGSAGRDRRPREARRCERQRPHRSRAQPGHGRRVRRQAAPRGVAGRVLHGRRWPTGPRAHQLAGHQELRSQPDRPRV